MLRTRIRIREDRVVERPQHESAERKVDIRIPGKVDVRLPGKVDSNSLGARPVHQIISMIKWIRTSRLSMKNSL